LIKAAALENANARLSLKRLMLRIGLSTFDSHKTNATSPAAPMRRNHTLDAMEGGKAPTLLKTA
jgi:hypothetical protein